MRFRIGTYINDDGFERHKIEQYKEYRWILFGTGFLDMAGAMREIDIFRLKESHEPDWKEV